MNNPPTLQHLAEAVDVLLQLISSDRARCQENAEQFSFARPLPDWQILPDWVSRLQPYVNLIRFELDLELQEGDLTANARLDPDGTFRIETVHTQTGLNPPVLDQDTDDTYTQLKTYLQSPNSCFLITPMIQLLEFIELAGGKADITPRLFIDKTRLLRELSLPSDISILFYVFADKFHERIHDRLYTDLDDLLLPEGRQEIILLLGDCMGHADGYLNHLLGRDYWPKLTDFQPALAERKLAASAVNFRNEECVWEISPSRLTPFHLFIQENALDHPDLVRAWMYLCAQACTTYLGNRTRLESGQFCTEFKGYRSLKVCVPETDHQLLKYQDLFGLFKWGYENASSDKLGIVRQVLAPQLVGTEQDNFSILVKRAGTARDESKNNFDDYLREKVDDYFSKRIQVIEFLQKFSDETGASVSKLASDLVGDLYKTVGIILGVVLAGLVDPKITFPVIYWTSMLYSIYILFVTFYLLLSAYLRYVGKVRDHEFNIEKIRSLLSEAEIERIQGVPFRRSKNIFRLYFALTEFVYLLLGGLAYLIMRSVAPYL